MPFPAGGGTDAFARPLAAHLGNALGKQIVIDNRGGAGGTLGAGLAARAPADGYNFFIGGAHHAIAPSVYPKLDYDIEKDFIPVILIAQPPQVVVVNASRTSATTLKQLIDEAKAKPGKLSYGSAGNGTSHHLAGELFKILTKTDIAHVPYRGAGPAMQDLLGGQASFMVDNVPTSLAHIRSGALKALVVSSEKRIPQLPDTPSSPDVGLPEFIGYSWVALLAPAKTPPAIVAKLAEAATAALADPAIKERLTDLSATVVGAGPDATAKFIAVEQAKWAPIVKATGATAN